MPDRRITTEHFLYCLALVVAGFFRLYHLGFTPLSDFEASHALQSLGQQPGVANIASASAAYRILTGFTFDLFGSGEFLARFWPAVAGSLLVLAPIFFRGALGRKAALILAFGLAIDPGLVAISRTAGGAMMAISFTFFALGWMWAGYPILAGIFAALALLSGPGSVVGLSIILVVFVITHLVHVSVLPAHPERNFKQELRPALAAAGITFLTVAAIFLWQPAGLSSLTNSASQYLSGWASTGGRSASQMLFMLAVYAPLPFLFILTQVVYWLARQSFSEESLEPPPVGTLLWLAMSCLIVFIYPGKQAWDLAWVIVPMWVFTAQALSQLLPEDKPHVISVILAGTIFILLALFWNTLVSSRLIVPVTAFDLPESTSRLLIQLILFVGVIGLGALSTVLVSLGWSPKISRDGLVMGLIGGFVIYSISTLWGVSQLRQNRPEEFWFPGPAAGQVGLFLDSVQQVSEQNTGFGQMIDILAVYDSPSLRWAVRDFPNARFANGLPPGEMPSIVISQQEDENPALEATYRGQDFAWSVGPGWSGDLPADLLNWMIARQASLTEKQVILWVRSDLFPGEQAEPATK